MEIKQLTILDQIERDKKEVKQSETILLINSIEWLPLALLCLIVDAILLDISFLITTIGNNPFSLSNILLDCFKTEYLW